MQVMLKKIISYNLKENNNYDQDKIKSIPFKFNL